MRLLETSSISFRKLSTACDAEIPALLSSFSNTENNSVAHSFGIVYELRITESWRFNSSSLMHGSGHFCVLDFLVQ
ncbi:hypothetical protein A2643_03285 [Candidatus Nomurabacteria bacterium RIFCSPHIGHO2_01_FULL_39_220]|uniref:Uncharacterized protein n=1 Tax=Candidatus Nomurabacteria bacterium RIFCSPHIGHO2_02_FULL_42_19 TaxID=1801756 RepID=A0A1F6W147_9BACT|nr:MAG: hypothetical protein A2643_03285 [Candidatus Nomurabacteria bacterium RIFCSPHIGHO2_01_FULL_39_220]OGI75435.1 MAG: hypothetical protein A3C67_00960 [Candidatus Nomurabacteria bacterium RIFCSPHIGHO2_02_FULL_42_19]